MESESESESIRPESESTALESESTEVESESESESTRVESESGLAPTLACGFTRVQTSTEQDTSSLSDPFLAYTSLLLLFPKFKITPKHQNTETLL